MEEKRLFFFEKIEEVNESLDKEWFIDAICGRDKLNDREERCSTKTLYNMVSRDDFDSKKLGCIIFGVVGELILIFSKKNETNRFSLYN